MSKRTFTMKLSVVFPVFISFTLVQNIDARPYPEDSSWSSWLFSWPTTVSNYYDGISTYFDQFNYGISKESADLLSQGSSLAHQVLDVLEYVPGLEPISFYGRLGMNVTDFLGKTAGQVVSMFHGVQESRGTKPLFGSPTSRFDLNSQFSTIVKEIESINSSIKPVVKIITDVIEKISNFLKTSD